MRVFALLLATVCLSSTSFAGPVAENLSAREDHQSRQSRHLRPVVEKRQQFNQGEPIDAKGKGGPILGELIHWSIPTQEP